MSETRIDTFSALIKASPEKIFQALTDQSALREWKAPEGMHMEIFHYNLRVDGTYRIALRYDDKKQKGKTGDSSDIVQGRFLELIPGKKIVEAIRFESTDPTYAGEMQMTTELSSEKGSTRVTFIAKNVPAGVSHEDHIRGMQSSLENLARYMA